MRAVRTVTASSIFAETISAVDRTLEAKKQGSITEAPKWLLTLIRDIFGNPFRPITLDSSWLTPTVTALAQAIYTDRTFTDLPILADALEEAGCTHPDLLNHLRSPGEHTRGCWALDLVMGEK
jgi:hypothetical protein